MQNTAASQGEKFVEIVRGIGQLSSSQQKFIQDMLSRRTKIQRRTGRNVLRKSFGLWAGRSDISNSRQYVTDLRKAWQARVERVKG